jgi:1-acyl-sn-glycerol-3-phosphate acyltransferase
LKFLLKPLQLLYVLWVFIAYSVFVLIGVPLFFVLHLLLDEVKAHRILMLGYANWWATVWGFLCGIRMQAVRNPNVKKEESYVFIANHNSNLDAMLWVYSVENLSKGLAKKEVLDFPVLGYLFKKTCVIVDRSDKESRRRSYALMKEEMNKGISIFIFPEGTRNKTGKPLQPFHDGAFRIAIDVQKPIAPVVMLNTGKLMPSGSLFYKPGKVKCIFLDPIPTEGLTEADLEELKNKTFAMMERVVEGSGNR